MNFILYSYNKAIENNKKENKFMVLQLYLLEKIKPHMF